MRPEALPEPGAEQPGTQCDVGRWRQAAVALTEQSRADAEVSGGYESERRRGPDQHHAPGAQEVCGEKERRSAERVPCGDRYVSRGPLKTPAPALPRSAGRG